MSSKPTVVVSASSLRGIEIPGEPGPGFQPALAGGRDAVDAEQRHAAQDEGRDGRRQVHALRQPAGRDRAQRLGLRQHVGQRMRSDGVDARAVEFLAERAAWRRQRRALDDLGGAERVRNAASSGRPVDAITCQPSLASSATAIEPTPPAAPGDDRRPLRRA